MASREDIEPNDDSNDQNVESEEEREEIDEKTSENQNEQEEEENDEENVVEGSGHEEVEENDQSKVESEADNESDEEFAGFGEEEIRETTKKRQIVSDDSDDENQENDEDNIRSKRMKNSDDEEEMEDNEAVEKEGNDEVEEENVETEEVAQESEEEEFVKPKKHRGDKPSDLELMLQKNKQQKAKNRRRKGDSEELNDWDNKISMIISEMKNVAAEDRAANEKHVMSLQKHKMLKTVQNMLQKSELHATMIELGVLGAIAEWLAPLPDRSLPNVSIREFLIDTLRDFGEINADYLKSSGIGKAVMFLYKHSKETKENKQKLERLINDWSRPIFSLDGNFKQLSKEERLERDLEHVKMMKGREKANQERMVDDLLNATEMRKSKKNKRKEDLKEGDETKKFLRPGEVGFCPRARVPIPSSKDYVIRPKSNVEAAEIEGSRKGKKSETRLDKHKKRFEEIRRQGKSSRAVTMVAAGGK